MNRYAIIATRYTEAECNDKSLNVGQLNADLTRMGWDVRFMRDCSSIFQAYQEAVTEIKPDDEDQVILCHDDIEILTKDSAFNKIIDSHLKKKRVGFVGVAGSAGLQRKRNWTASLQRYMGGGMISHGKSVEQMDLTCFYGNGGTINQAVVLDGVFLATTGKVLDRIQLKMPKGFSGGWHWYDASYTLQAHLLGFNNFIVPIHLRHESSGNYDSLFYRDSEVFHELFKKHLPAVIRKF